MRTTLTITARHYSELRAHLFPGDGLEAVAILLCGRRAGDEAERLLAREVVAIPHNAASRHATSVRWSTDTVPQILERARAEGLSLVKVHSHPGGFDRFSATDDESDSTFFSSVAGWIEDSRPHASAVLLPGGRLFGRTYRDGLQTGSLERVMVLGDDIAIHFAEEPVPRRPEVWERQARAFGQRTVAVLQRLSVAVVGCSGTGGPVIEQLARLGVGHLVLVDPDTVSAENLNRIPQSTFADCGRPKVDVIAGWLARMGIGTRVSPIQSQIADRSAVEAVAACDFVFGCMDGVDGRSVLNRLATFYLVPYIDLGVRLEADDVGAITEVSAAVHYLQPHGSSLLSRGVFTAEQVRAASLRRSNPSEYRRQLEAKYIIGADEARPAVISVNYLTAALGVCDFLARLNDYRTDGNARFAECRVSLSHVAFYADAERAGHYPLAQFAGFGDVEPRLDLPELSRPRN